MSKKQGKNLVPFDKRTESEQREITKKGGKKSGEVRRARKAFKEGILLALNSNSSNGLSFQDMVIAALIKRATMGDTKAFELIRDTIGEKPQDKILIEDERLSEIKISVVDKSIKIDGDVDPKIIGEYTPPVNIDE